jgi:hypothetical protein
MPIEQQGIKFNWLGKINLSQFQLQSKFEDELAA